MLSLSLPLIINNYYFIKIFITFLYSKMISKTIENKRKASHKSD